MTTLSLSCLCRRHSRFKALLLRLLGDVGRHHRAHPQPHHVHHDTAEAVHTLYIGAVSISLYYTSSTHYRAVLTAAAIKKRRADPTMVVEDGGLDGASCLDC